MNYSFYRKIGIIAVLVIGLLIPRSALIDLVYERMGWRQQAYNSIQQSWPGEQTLAGPVLVVPYKIIENVKETTYDFNKLINETGKVVALPQSPLIKKEVTKEVATAGILYLLPKKLSINSQQETSMRARGIYEIPVYANVMAINGEFDLQPLKNEIERYKDKNIVWGIPFLSVLVRDQRGIAYPPSLKWGDSDIAFEPGSNLANAERGMSAKLPMIDPVQTPALSFAFNMELKGMRSINFALLANDTSIKLSSNWASPSFTGELLPDKRDISEKGFNAEWRASSFSHNASSLVESCRKGDCTRLLEKTIGFDLIQPVDVYQQSERSVKYAFLFIVLTFVVLILLELMKKLRIHPIQYSFVGMALLVFYLLLISLAEHINFGLAYASGAIASTLLLTVYFGAILYSHKLGLILGGGLSTLYSLLYVILQSEDNALLMGSVLIFAILSLLMLSTRNLDWYALTNNQNKAAQEG